MTTDPAKPPRRQNHSSLFGPVGHAYCARAPTTLQDEGSRSALFEKQQRASEKADLRQLRRYEASSSRYIGPSQCETARLPWNALWTPEMLHDFETDGRPQTGPAFAEPIVNGSNKVASWSDDTWFALHPDSQLDMTAHAPLLCGSKAADFCLPYESETAARLLEHDLTCSQSLGSEGASGNGAYSALSPCTACSTSPNPLMQVGGDVDWSEYRPPLDRGSGRTHQALCEGGLNPNAPVPLREGSREQWPNDVAYPSLLSVWLDDHLSGSSDATYQDGAVFSPRYQEPPDISISPSMPHRGDPQGSDPLEFPCGSLDLGSPQLQFEDHRSPVAFDGCESPAEPSWNRPENMAMVVQDVAYARRRGAIGENHYQAPERPAVVPQHVYSAGDMVPKASLQWSGHHRPPVVPRSWPSRQRLQRTRTQSQPRLTQRTDPRDVFLVQSKLAGMSYREIRDRGKFTEAESTLRGRFRTLTKDKENRVRKPEWKEHDVRLLLDGVEHVTRESRLHATGQSTREPARSLTRTSKIPWKQVAEFIATNGGSYHFGNATCRKKWDEIQGRRQ